MSVNKHKKLLWYLNYNLARENSPQLIEFGEEIHKNFCLEFFNLFATEPLKFHEELNKYVFKLRINKEIDLDEKTTQKEINCQLQADQEIFYKDFCEDSCAKNVLSRQNKKESKIMQQKYFN
jgi:hypothetical protein